MKGVGRQRKRRVQERSESEDEDEGGVMKKEGKKESKLAADDIWPGRKGGKGVFERVGNK